LLGSKNGRNRYREPESFSSILSGSGGGDDDHCCEDDHGADHERKCLSNALKGGLYYISEGHCLVRNTGDWYCPKTLTRGDFFGESELIKCVDYTFFGEIVAKGDVQCWYLPIEHYSKIPYFE